MIIVRVDNSYFASSTDNKTISGYQETYILYCISSNLEVLTEYKETASSIKTTLKAIATRSNAQEIDRDSDYLEEKSPASMLTRTEPQELTTTKTTRTISRLIECIKPKPCPTISSRKPCPICPTIEITTTRTSSIPATASRTTIILATTVEPTKITASTTPVTTTIVFTTTRKPNTTTTKTTSITTINITTPSPCCDRPDTWSTTTEEIFPYFFPDQLIENNDVIVEITKITDPPTRHTTTPTPWTSKPSTTTKATVIPTRITSRLTTTTNNPITITSIPITTTVKASAETNSCCDRPGSWKTTIDDYKAYSFPFQSVESNTQIILASKKTDSTNSYTTTENPATITTMRTIEQTTKIVEPTPTTAEQTIITKRILNKVKMTLPPVVPWSTTPTAMEINETITENKPCCNRPATWSTTTEKVVPYFVQEKSVSVEDNEVLDDPSIIDKTFDISSKIDVPPESLTSTEPPSPSTTEPPSSSTTVPPSPSPTVPPSPSLTETSPPSPPNSGTFEVNVPQKLILNSDSEENERSPPKIEILKKTKTKQTHPQTTWRYPSMCPGSRCDRPQVWSTTRSRRTRRWNGGGWK